eukprot:CAMPEP_0117082310 /NCGR_PEP_ID=MMETSP0472-20121206/57972_1 /TAXON_ID=693140 ORGANISM="Tiarina fusus, Strain LIS" /NCGR_SAMPLE_ID=MMETSP0472 /ASSEMBLY_ACC=CAM_ASM_000603 /LENGTH=562 /DNA_ID=CAMNT_0004810515 /DNA_START=77 /DNA_END=1761 /DNA_ORIENTATION=+
MTLGLEKLRTPTRSASTSIDEESVRQGLREVPTDNPETNSRIILLAAHSQHAFPILEIADSIGFQPDTIWVGPSSWIGSTSLTNSQVSPWMKRHPGYLGAVPFSNENDVIFQAFLSALQQKQELENREVWDTLPIFGPQLVDSVITMVMTLVSVEPLRRRQGLLVFDSMKAMEFDGVGGKVHFTDEGDLKDPQFSIMQLGEYVNGEDPVWSKVGLTGTQVDTARRTDVDTPMCFPVTGCVNSLSDVPGDSYSVPRDKLPVWTVALIVLVFALLVCLGFKYWRSHRSKRAIKKELDTFRDSVVGMRTAIAHYVPTATSLDGEEDVVVEQAKGNTASDSLVIHSKAKVTWCWRETPHYMNTHGPEDIEGDPSDCWIKYDDNSNSKLETAFQLQNGVGAYSPLPGYSVGFVTMKQTKLATGFQRDVQRLVSEPPKPIGGSRRVDLNGARIGERLPAEIQNEPQMVLVKGDVLQISKQRPDGWGFGTKLHHVDEAAARELVAHATGTYPGDDGEDLVGDGDEANIFADTGWFQLDATDLPSAEDLASLQKRVGDTDVLQAPPNWDP